MDKKNKLDQTYYGISLYYYIFKNITIDFGVKHREVLSTLLQQSVNKTERSLKMVTFPAEQLQSILYVWVWVCITCPRKPARVVVKLTSVTTETASGGMKGEGFLVARKRRKSSL